MFQILKQPLIQFLAMGALLFGVFEVINSDNANSNPREIVIDRSRLLNFMQFRSKAFNAEAFGEQLDALPDAERQELIKELVREEVLYREALSLGMDKDDYIIKRRLIQKLEFVTKNFSDATVTIDEAAVREHYQKNQKRYAVEPNLTFTHVFFSHESHDEAHARKLAETTLAELNARNVSFSEAIGYGERFLFHANYVDRSPSLLAAHLGKDMTDTLLQTAPSNTLWRGPFRSKYGEHLVLLTENTPGYVPPLEDIREQLVEDLRRETIANRNEQTIQALVDAYTIKIADDIITPTQSMPAEQPAQTTMAVQ